MTLVLSGTVLSQYWVAALRMMAYLGLFLASGGFSSEPDIFCRTLPPVGPELSFGLMRVLQSSALVFKGFHLSFLFAALYCLGFGKCSEGKIALCLRPPETLPKDVNSLCPSLKLCTGFSAFCSCPASANAVTVGSFFQGYSLSVESKPLYLSLP